MSDYKETRHQRVTRRKLEKQEQAKRIQEAYDALSPQDKLQRLDAKLGIGVGAKRQRAKLQALVDQGKR